DPRAPIGYELGVTDLRVIHQSADYPITPKEHGVAFLLDHRHLWLRSSRQQAIMRVRAEVIRACREYFDGQGFLPFDAPILTPAGASAGPAEATDLAEDFRVHVVRRVREQRAAELRVLERDPAPLARVEKPFPRITYAEALDVLRGKGFALEWGADLGGDEET